MLHGQTISAAFVTAVGLAFPLAATPLPYTQDTSCSVLLLDGTTSTECDNLWADTDIQFEGADGSNRVYAVAGASAAAYIYPEETGLYEDGWGVSSSSVTANLSFVGITPGPVRLGTADIVIVAAAEGRYEGPLFRPTVSYNGFPDFVCEPWRNSAGVCDAIMPFTLGQPFSFRIDSFADMDCSGPCYSQGEFTSVELHVWNGAGNAVPIYAASSVPEPGYLASFGLALIAAAYAVRPYRRRTKACPFLIKIR
jgi:hypothetical protein